MEYLISSQAKICVYAFNDNKEKRYYNKIFCMLTLVWVKHADITKIALKKHKFNQ